MTKWAHAGIRHCKRTFVPQTEQSDCGIACLRSIIRYYGSDTSLEDLRQLSGTSPQGTTMLGLYQAAQHHGFDPRTPMRCKVSKEHGRTVHFACNS